MAKHKEVPEHIQRLLREVVDHFDKEDRAVRERQIRLWKKLKYYWNGFQRVWWSEVAHDWRVYDVQYMDQTGDASFYDKPVNIFRAYLESIIAALSVTVPSINCAPDDADNPLDISTAKAGDTIAELVYKHNDVTLLWLHALYIFCTEGLVCAYSYPKEDKAYGEYEKNEYEDIEQEVAKQICPICKTMLADKELSNQERDEFAPDDSDILGHDLLNQGMDFCPQCLQTIEPELQVEKIIVPRLVGITKHPKTRQCIEVYGGLYVKVANYAMKQADTPYLIFSYETHYSNVLERYPFLKDKFKASSASTKSSGIYDPYERWGRLSTQYYGEYPLNTPTVRNAWLRHAAFNVLSDEDDIEELKKLYPDGSKVVLINDQFADAENESLDDCWTLTHNPLSDYLHHDPMGLLLTSIQEITNDIISLTLQTIEHGISQTFADPNVLNFDQYRQVEATPGMIFPAKPASGKSLGEAFYELKTANLSGEILPFMMKIEEAGQLVSGALPSLFGGAQPNSSKTAAQYSMSRAQAMQRLQIPWKMLTVWWKQIFGKVIPAYIKCVVEDEKFVKKSKAGNFVNVFVRKAELQGKIGNIELEASEQLPITWAQQKDIIMQMLQASNPMVMQALTSPENLPYITEAIGLRQFVIPGEDDRTKQYEEIQLLVESQPIEDPSGMEPMVPSVDIEPMIDNNQIHSDICRGWLVSEAGRLAKMENPAGYQNVMLHMQRHVKVMQVMSMNAAQETQPQQKEKPIAAQVKQRGQLS